MGNRAVNAARTVSPDFPLVKPQNMHMFSRRSALSGKWRSGGRCDMWLKSLEMHGAVGED